MIDNGSDGAFVKRRFVGDRPLPNRRLRGHIWMEIPAVAAHEHRELQQTLRPQMSLARALLAQCMTEGEGMAEIVVMRQCRRGQRGFEVCKMQPLRQRPVEQCGSAVLVL